MTTAFEQILIADRAGAWRERLAEALEALELTVGVTDDGDALERALLAPQGDPRIVVAGDGLAHVGAIDALYRARAALAAAPRADAPGGRAIFLVTDVRIDLDVLDLLYRRGVSAFLYRDEPLDAVVDRLRATAFRDRRRSVRYPVRTDAALTVGDAFVEGTLDDVSADGAQFSVAQRRLEVELAQGAEAYLAFEIGDARVDCPAVIRRLGLRRRLLGDRVVVGLQLRPPDDAARAALDAAVRAAVLELAVRQRIDPDDAPEL